MTALGQSGPRTDPAAREVVGALASFWHGGDGPSHSSISSALALAGVDQPEDSNKEQRVHRAFQGAAPDSARRIVEELVELLRSGGYLSSCSHQAQVDRLRMALARVGVELTDDGFINWPAELTRVATSTPPESRLTTSTTPTTANAASGNNREFVDVSIDLLVSMLRRVPLAARPLILRRRSRRAFPLDDEYDLQDIVEAVLRLTYADVRPEERTPSSAGSSSQLDFLVRGERCAVEVKVTKPGRAEKQIKPEILVDINDYQGHPNVDTLIVAVYDLSSTFSNPSGFESDLSGRHNDLEVTVVVAGGPVRP